MSEKIDAENIVVQLRERTEEANMHEYLKSAFGGYTKKSVNEYFSTLRKQQLAMQESFKRNLEEVLLEKETLRNDYDCILISYNELSLKYDNLAESIKSVEFQENEYSFDEFLSLKKTIAVLEEELKKTIKEKENLIAVIDKQKRDTAKLYEKLEQSAKEKEAQNQLILSEKMNSKKLRDEIISISNKLDEEKKEVKYLKYTLSEEKYTELNSQIVHLTEQLTALTEVSKTQNEENLLKDKTISSLNEEIYLLKERLNTTQQTEQLLNLQNNKLLLANEELKNTLQHEYKKLIDSINEKSDLKIEKLMAQQNLREAELKLSSIEIKET